MKEFSKKRFLILGGAADQLPLYRSAKKMGLYIIGCDRNVNALARSLADEFFPIGIDDPEVISRTLKNNQIDGIASPATDAGHRSVYELSWIWDLPFKPSLPAVKCSANKGALLKLIADLGFACQKYAHSTDLDRLKTKANEIGFPLIVKPVDSSGSKGLTYVDSPEKLNAALVQAFSFSVLKEILLEEYIKGTHYGAEVFRLRGKTILLAVSRKIDVFLSGRFVTGQHFMSPQLPPALQSTLESSIDQICDRLEVADGSVNLDFIVNDDQKIFIHDLGARMGGNGLSEVVKCAYGLDIPELTIKLALGEKINPDLSFRKIMRHAGLRMLVSRDTGFFKTLQGMDEIKQHPAFINLELFVKPGEPVAAFSQANQKIGYVLAAHEKDRLLMDFLAEIDSKVKVLVGSDPDVRV